MGQPSCRNYVDSFNYNFNHISELDRLCKKGLLVDDTVEFKSFKNWSISDLNLKHKKLKQKDPRTKPPKKQHRKIVNHVITTEKFNENANK